MTFPERRIAALKHALVGLRREQPALVVEYERYASDPCDRVFVSVPGREVRITVISEDVGLDDFAHWKYGVFYSEGADDFCGRSAGSLAFVLRIMRQFVVEGTPARDVEGLGKHPAVDSGAC